MSKGPLILWLVIELGRLCLTPAASQTVVRAFLGQPVTLPCTYSSWSPNSNSMCWGKGQCPNSRCNDELLYTDGTRVVSSKSPKYQLQGVIQRGDVSLTIINAKEGDQGVYCCRIEVPGWFNDVKSNIRLDLRRAPTTTRSTTTRRPTTTTTSTTAATTAATATTATAMTTVTAVLPTTAVTTSDLTSTPPLQKRTTAVLATTASLCPLTTLRSLTEEDTILLTLEPSTEGPILTAAPETSFLVQNEVEPEQIRMTSNYELLMIVAPSLGFVLLALLLAFFLRGKFVKANCFQKHSRLDDGGEGKDVLSGTEDEDGLFTL
ncbi:T-cell immunoglobulin and mucin domain-containing protein 4 isoform X2 [Moschus berezovskii]|uniref:T-cell immunoglobulin and mucin domain-containing protein 4 isoform X2 n=1 Tax=Moschus berezovskii TaxID=68408 RepID=UPI0024442EBC|nr:T-cell immunoglobulin and mucin domain-containing protein 4 isoform X2 [Moschus berezovskii]